MLLYVRDTKATKATKIKRKKVNRKIYNVDNQYLAKNNFTFLRNIFIAFVDNRSLFYIFNWFKIKSYYIL